MVFFLFFIFVLEAPSDFPAGQIVSIKDGANLRSVSKELKSENIIRSRVAFETLSIIFGGEKHIVSGDYLFERKVSVWEVSKRLTRGERRLIPVKVTIPEGFSLEEMAKIFSLRLSKFNESNFLARAKEGYLFPDTYFFLTTDTEREVIKSMTDNFNKKIAGVIPDIERSSKREGDIIIMASIIEEESKGEEDRNIISGILWKRLGLGMPLQVDSDPETYKTRGLPEKPISSPGIESIRAAIFPKSSPYLYYLHDKDGNVRYARTFEEHKLNKAKYLK